MKSPPPSLLDKIGRFPTSPGVYLMKDERARILYIGKAVNLRSRVRSYFGKSSDTRLFVRFLVERVRDIDCLVAESEAEALILENNLIKKHRPVYNIRLKDDKTYVSIQVSLSEIWPRLRIVRRFKKDGNLYFGPYGSAGAVREMLRVIEKVFPLRNCTNGFFRGRTRPCIEHELGRCTAPCVGLVTRERYLEDVNDVILFLKGQKSELERQLEGKMRNAAAEKKFELAARYRDQISAIRKVFETQKAQEFRLGDLDAFALVREGDHSAVQELTVRDGKITSSQCHSFRTTLDSGEILSSFLSQYYLDERYIPPEVLTSEDFPDRDLLEAWLSERRGSKVRIHVPQRGDKFGLIQLARKNALTSFHIDRTAEEKREATLRSLSSLLGLSSPLRRIECFDISNFQGSLAVGAMVTFEDGEPAKNRYRKFRIQTVVGADDFRSMREVLDRRLRRGLEEKDLPDLILIDGGKGQLGVATALFRELGVEGVGVAALAKERRRKGTAERIFVPGRGQPLPIPPDAPESLFLQRIRDEAHRFAVSYHRELRRKKTLRTGLEDVPGIGKARTQALIDRFRTLERLRAASIDDIAAVVGPKLGARVYEILCRGNGDGPAAEIETKTEAGTTTATAIPEPSVAADSEPGGDEA